MFTPNVIRSVGASTSRRGSGRGSPGSVSVSPIVTSGRPGDRHDVAGSRLVDVDAVDALRGLERRHRAGERHGPARLDGAGRVVGLLANDADPLAHPDRAVPDPPDRHPPDVLVRRQVRDEQLERVARRVARRRRDVDQDVEEGPEVRARLVEVGRRRAGLGVRVDDREVDLVVVGAEVDEQLVDGVEDLRRPGVAAVDLVDRHDDRQAARHRLLEDVAGLRQRAFRRVDEEQHAVDHEQRSLHLAAEVGVAGRVDDVQADAVVIDGRLLREDRDPLLALEVAGIQDAVDELLVRPERAGLAEHRVDERGLAVVHVRDDRDVPELGADLAGAGEVFVEGRADPLEIGHGPADCPTRPERQRRSRQRATRCRRRWSPPSARSRGGCTTR